MKKLIGLTFVVIGLATSCHGLNKPVSVAETLGGVGACVLGLLATWEAERGKK